jgi:hypothetical protein
MDASLQKSSLKPLFDDCNRYHQGMAISFGAYKQGFNGLFQPGQPRATLQIRLICHLIVKILTFREICDR